MNETTPLLIITPPSSYRCLNEEEEDDAHERYGVSLLELEDDTNNILVVDRLPRSSGYHQLTNNIALLPLLMCGGVIVIVVVSSLLQGDVVMTFDYSSAAAISYLFHPSRPYKWLSSPLFPRLGRIHHHNAAAAPHDQTKTTSTSVAFLGNSMLYFNDFPRFFEEISSSGSDDGSSSRTINQNSCLHGSASIASLLHGNNGMYPKFKTHNAVLGKDMYGQYIHDYGACTVSQLLLGHDVQQLNNAINDKGEQQQQLTTMTTNNKNNVNPCNADIAYREYNTYIINHQQQSRSMMTKSWDYVVINDNTLHPARHETRYQSLQALEQYYIPWLLATKSTPVFIWTYAYTRADNSMSCSGGGDDINTSSSNSRTRTKEARDMTGLEDITKFTYLTGIGYKEYAKLLTTQLPSEQTPRIAPVGLAYLAIHDENYTVWQSLFHCDGLHASPAGTFLQGCIIYYTLFNKMPNRNVVLRENMATLWTRARMMQHVWDPPNKFPDIGLATYLYEVAERIMVEGYIPISFLNYTTE